MDDLVVHKLNPGVPCNFFTHIDILNVSSSGRQLTLNLTGGRYLTTYYTIEKFQQWLKSVPFARVHKEHLVNLDHIYSFDQKSESIILSDKSQIPYVRKFVPQIMNYIFNNDDYMRVNDISDTLNPKM
jgi:DNA-binding LytR/AlgR family response regulator